MTNRLSGKVAVVTGGCRGIGKSIVEKFAGEGTVTYALDFVIPGDNEIFIDNPAIKDQIFVLQADVTSEESVKNAYDTILEKHSRIDILVNNAGITRDNLVIRMSIDDWDKVINTNLKGTFICSKLVARTMMAQRSGRIINISSVVGVMGNAGQVNYSSSKAGVIGLTKSLAKEFGSRNILVNCIAPGYVETAMTHALSEEQRKVFVEIIPLKRGATPEDIANVATFFASDDSSYITGQVLNVDGGMLM